MLEELWASVLIPLATEDGEPPEDELTYDEIGYLACDHGNDPETCWYCHDDDLRASHEQAEAEWDYEDEPL